MGAYLPSVDLPDWGDYVRLTLHFWVWRGCRLWYPSHLWVAVAGCWFWLDYIFDSPTYLDVTFSLYPQLWKICQSVFRSSSEIVVLYLVVILVCPWKEVSGGSSSFATLIWTPQDLLVLSPKSDHHISPHGERLTLKKLKKFFFIQVGFPGGSDGKESACNTGDPGSIPESGRSPREGNGYPLQYSCLENSLDRGAWWAMGSQRIGHDGNKH